MSKARAIETALQERTLALFKTIKMALRSAKIGHLKGSKAIKYSGLLMTKSPKPAIYLHMEQSLWADVSFSPQEFANLASNREIGQALVSMTEEALGKLSDHPEFPVEVIRGACAVYKAADYSLLQYTREKPVVGTPMKAQVDTYIDALNTRQVCTVRYRGKTLFSTVLKEFNQVDWTLSADFYGATLEGQTMTFWPKDEDETNWWRNLHGKLHPLMRPAEIDLAQFPDALAFITEKGWV